jgi:hypothetical protein
MAVGDLWLNLIGTLRDTFRIGNGKATLDASGVTAKTFTLPNRTGTFALTTLGEALNTSRATVASHATTADIWGAAGNQIDWTGTATCTAFPAAPQAGAERVLVCAAGCRFTAGANMIIDGLGTSGNLDCVANDVVIVRALTTTQFRLSLALVASNGGAWSQVMAAFVSGLGAYTTMDDTDLLGVRSGVANLFQKITWANVKASIKTYLDSLTTTFTNKRITARVGTTTSHATPTINTDNVDVFRITAQAEAITSMTTNLSGTPVDSDCLVIEITGTAARAITWGASFEASTVALPTTTVSTNKLTVGFLYNSVTSKWRCVAAV